MSYKDLIDQYELVAQELRKGSTHLSSICDFFKSHRRSTKKYAALINKESESLESVYGDNEDTLSTAIAVFKSKVTQKSVNFTNFAGLLTSEIIEPLDSFIVSFTSITSQLGAKAASILRNLKRSREKASKLQQKYYHSSAAAEKSAELAKAENVYEKRERAIKHSKSANMAAEEALKSYSEGVAEANSCWDIYEQEMPKIMAVLQEHEERRVNAVKVCLETYRKLDELNSKASSDSANEMIAIIENINSEIDIRVFVALHKSKQLKRLREEVVFYDEHKNKEFFEGKIGIMQVGGLFVQEIVGYLIPDQQHRTEAPDEWKYSRVSELLHSPYGRDFFVECLENKSELQLVPSENIEKLAALINSMLTAILVDNDLDPYVFTNIVELSSIFCTFNGNTKELLSYYLKGHSIWADPSRWVRAIEYAAELKNEADKECAKRIDSERKGAGFLNTIKSFANIIEGAFQKDPSLERAMKSSLYTVASQFNYYMFYMDIPIDIATKVILVVAKNIGLDPERTCYLLAELQRNVQPLKWASTSAQLSIKKTQRKLEKWGELVIFRDSIEFLPVEDLCSVLLVCKLWYYSFKPPILSKLVHAFKLRNTFTPAIRTCFWKESLNTSSIKTDYFSILSILQTDESALGELSDVIELDVARSFQRHETVPKSSLTNILNSFAFYDKGIGYCQGMNYIAGILYLQLQEEQTAFHCMISMLRKFSMRELLVKDLPKLKQYFYQMDRLIGMLLPEVQRVFNELRLSASHFSSSWFITVFAGPLNSKPEVLLEIWDLFFQKGWKIIFKIGICILQELSEALVSGTFEEIMNLLSSVSLSAGQSSLFDEAFIDRVNKVEITNSSLEALAEEYSQIILLSNNV